jgi:hypothetical protein
VLRGLRAGLSEDVGPYDQFEKLASRRRRRQWALAAATILCALAIGFAGYAIGSAQVNDADTVEQAGLNAGEQRGSAVGAREGYARAFKAAREHAFASAYRQSYAKAYRRQFEKANLSAPQNVKVSLP